MIKDVTKQPKWMTLMPNVKNVDGSLNLDMGADHTNVDDLTITGDKLEILGWMHIQKKNNNGRIYAK